MRGIFDPVRVIPDAVITSGTHVEVVADRNANEL